MDHKHYLSLPFQEVELMETKFFLAKFFLTSQSLPFQEVELMETYICGSVCIVTIVVASFLGSGINGNTVL